MTREERAKREQLLAQYGYQLDDVVEGADGEAEIMYKDHAASGGTAKGGGDGEFSFHGNFGSGRNRTRVVGRRVV